MEEQREKTEQQLLEEQAAIFAALGDPTRLKLMRHLCHDCRGKPVCVNYLATVLGISSSGVSQHLRILKAAGLVSSQRRGFYVHYSINPDAHARCCRMSANVLDIKKFSITDECEQNCSGRKE
jgi:ArsR family transcriptional regulator